MTNFTIEAYVQTEKTSARTGNVRKEWVFIGHSEMPDLTVITEWKVKGNFLHTVEFGKNCRYNLQCVWDEKGDFVDEVEEEAGPEVAEVIYKAYFEESREAFTMVSNTLVYIIGEQAVEWEDGEHFEQYIYTFKDEPERGEFVARKENIIEL